MGRQADWPPNINGQPVPYGLPVEQLAAMLGEPAAAKVASVALAQLGTPESLDVLAPLLLRNDRDWRLRRIGLDAVAMHPLGHREASQVLALLDDPVASVVYGAEQAAGRLGLADAVPRLLENLQSSDTSIMSGAHNALLNVQSPGDELPLMEMYSAADYNQRKSIGTILYSRVRPGIWFELFELFRCSDVDEHREVAARLAHEFGSADNLPEIEFLAQDRNGHVRGAAQRAIRAVERRSGAPGTGPRTPGTPLWPSNLARDG